MSARRVLYIGGTGEISQACLEASVAAGDDVTVLNRGNSAAVLPPGVAQIAGNVKDANGYANLGEQTFDVVCQFLAFTADDVVRDIGFFRGRCSQYVFVSSASAYQKPPQSHVITETTPLANPFWAYSRAKAACEHQLQRAHDEGQLNVTIVRPSHTYRTRLPGTCISGDHMIWRMLRNKPVIVHGDGQSLWTLTHSADFSRAFTALFGEQNSFGETCHITDDMPYTWDVIVRAVASAAGCEVDIRHVASQALIQYQPGWEGPLLGDKANSVCFDNSKVRSLIGHWQPQLSLQAGFALAWPFVLARLNSGFAPNQQEDQLIDRIIADQQALGQ